MLPSEISTTVQYLLKIVNFGQNCCFSRIYGHVRITQSFYQCQKVLHLQGECSHTIFILMCKVFGKFVLSSSKFFIRKSGNFHVFWTVNHSEISEVLPKFQILKNTSWSTFRIFLKVISSKLVHKNKNQWIFLGPEDLRTIPLSSLEISAPLPKIKAGFLRQKSKLQYFSNFKRFGNCVYNLLMLLELFQ